MNKTVSIACLIAATALAGCGTSKYAVVPTTSGALCLLQPFVTNPDGSLTTAQMDAGIAAGFRAADRDGSGNLEFAELAPLNDARAQTCDQTPLTDWSGRGVVGQTEYGARYKTAFDMSDLNQDGYATHDEMLYAKPKPPKPKKAPLTPDDSTQTQGGGAGQY